MKSAAQTQGTGVGREPHTLGTAGLTAGSECMKSMKGRGMADIGNAKQPWIWTMRTLVIAPITVMLAVFGLWLLLYWVTT